MKYTKFTEEATLQAPSLSQSRSTSSSFTLPWYVYAVTIASTSIVVGLLWDISWHMTIGRDAFLSPPHIAIYLGGLIAGFGGGYLMIRTTFFASAAEKARSVWFWGFRSPLGALLLVWGALAMLTSAPFDDWWHNAYGLDVKILSPPHAVLGLGICIIQLGSVISLLSYQNRLEGKQELLDSSKLKTIRILYTYAVAMLIAVVSVLSEQFTRDNLMHSSIFYQVSSAVFPLFLISAGRASGMRWPATSAAAAYMLVFLLMTWILPLFPAVPRLGPVLHDVDHFVPFRFPLLLIVPAFFVDIVMRKTSSTNPWLGALFIGATFFGVFLITQWFFGYFYMSPYARNWFFTAGSIPYYANEDYIYRYAFYPWDKTTFALVKGLGIAFILSYASSLLGLFWGNWMKKVQR